MARIVYLVCLVSTVSGHSQKGKKKGQSCGASSRHITKLKQTMNKISMVWNQEIIFSFLKPLQYLISPRLCLCVHNGTQHNNIQHNNNKTAIFSIMTLSILTDNCYADWLLLMVSVTYNPCMLRVIMLNVMAPNNDPYGWDVPICIQRSLWLRCLCVQLSLWLRCFHMHHRHKRIHRLLIGMPCLPGFLMSSYVAGRHLAVATLSGAKQNFYCTVYYINLNSNCEA